MPVIVEKSYIHARHRGESDQDILLHQLTARRIFRCEHNLCIELSSVHSRSTPEFEKDRLAGRPGFSHRRFVIIEPFDLVIPSIGTGWLESRRRETNCSAS
jgi:hypothetical protein